MTGRPVDPSSPVLPRVVYGTSANADAPLTITLYGVEDAKLHLNIAMDDSADDSRLAVAISQAVGELETHTGLRFSDQTLVAEYGGQCREWWVASVPSPNITSITSVSRVDSEGVETAVSASDYDLLWVNSRPVIRLKPATTAFSAGEGIVAKVSYVTGVGRDTRAGQVARAALNDLVEFAFTAGDDRIDPRSKKSFARAIRVLRDTTGERLASL